MSIEADWSRYARFYDSMAQHNPAYQQLVELYTQEIQGWSIPDGALLAEVGAGTGNFSIPLAEVFPGSSVLHIDINPGMNASAWAKSQQRGVKNLKIEQTSAKELHLEPGTLHGLVAVHALYTFPKPQAFIEQAYQWLQPGGIFFACDPCKALDVREWSAYIFQSTLKRRGLVYTLGLFARSWEAIRQNRRIASGLQSGSYWNHTRDEFTRTFVEAGYQILQSYCCNDGQYFRSSHHPG